MYWEKFCGVATDEVIILLIKLSVISLICMFSVLMHIGCVSESFHCVKEKLKEKRLITSGSCLNFCFICLNEM